MSDQHNQNHPEEENGLSPFEQQLRSIDPAPPQTAWQDIAQLLESQPKVTASVSAAARPVSGWLRGVNHAAATHAAATLIGVGMGAVLMVMLQPAATTPAAATPVDVEPTQQIAVEPERSKPDHSVPKQLVNEHEFERPRRLMRSMDGNRTTRSWTLTPLARDIESRPWERISYEQRPAMDEESSATTLPEAIDKPMSAPELLRQLLKDQAHSQRSRGIESETKKTTRG